MKLKERITLAIVILLTALIGFCLLWGYLGVEFSIPFSFLGLIGGGILMRDEKNWKWGLVFLLLISVIATVVSCGTP